MRNTKKTGNSADNQKIISEALLSAENQIIDQTNEGKENLNEVLYTSMT